MLHGGLEGVGAAELGVDHDQPDGPVDLGKSLARNRTIIETKKSHSKRQADKQ